MASKSKIKPILEHLAWLNEQAGMEINRDRVYDAALLTWNAAHMLQWHFVMPISEADQIGERAARDKAAKLIDDFVWAMKAVFEKAEALKECGVHRAEKANECRAELQKRIGILLRRLPDLFALESPKPVRLPELERTEDHAKLLQKWVIDHPRSTATDRGQLHQELEAGPGAGIRRIIGGLFVANASTEMNTSRPRVRRIFRQTLAAFAEFDCGEAAERSRGTAKKRFLELSRSIATRLRASGGRK